MTRIAVSRAKRTALLLASAMTAFTPAIAMAQDGGVVRLDTVLVEDAAIDATAPDTASPPSDGGASPERADGPVDGVVAERSATGTKTDTPLVSTPQSISVVTNDQIELTAAQNPSEALRYNAGVQVERFGNDPRYDWIKIRGFDAPSYLDGLILPNSTYATPRYEPYGIERLEVLKGPASVLYGETPPGGLINFVSKKPLGEAQREVRFQIGNHDRVEAAFDVTGPANDEGTVLYRMIGLGRLSDAEVDFVDDDRAFIAPSFTFAPTGDTSLTVQAFYIRDDATSLQFLPSQGTLFSNPNGDIPRSRFTGEPGYDDFEREQWGVGYEFEHDFTDDLTVRQNLRYTSVDVELPVVRAFGFADADLRDVTRRAVLFDDKIEGLTVDNQLLWSVSTGPLDHQFLAGLDYRRFESDFSTSVAPAPTLDIFDPDYGQPLLDPALRAIVEQRVEQTGVYLQDQIRFDNLVLLLGGRYDWTENRTTNGLTDLSSEQDNEAFTGRAGLLYEFDNGISPYVSYSTLFQPTVGVAFAGGLTSPAFAADGEPFEPTTGDQIEGGVKYQPPGTDSLFTASVFRIEQNDLLVARPGGGNQQTGAVEVSGAEFEAKVAVSDRLDLIASYSYLDSEITETTDPLELGNELAVLPNHQAAGFLAYTFDSGLLNGLKLGAGVRYFGKAYGDLENTIEVPSYTLVDAVASYDLAAFDERLEGAEIAVNANNLFDKDYVSTCGDLNTCYYGNGRQVFGTLTYRW